MTDHGEPWDNQGHHSNIYDANGDGIATVFNHRARIIACVNACKEYDNPADIPHAESYINMSLELDNAKGTIKQLRDLLAAAPDLYDGCNALLGLLQLIRDRDDVSDELAEILSTSHRVKEAEQAVAKVKGK